MIRTSRLTELKLLIKVTLLLWSPSLGNETPLANVPIQSFY